MSDRKSIGRPHELTPDVLAKLVDAFRSGATRDQAAAAAGVPRRTLFAWLARGEKESGPFRELSTAAAISDERLRDIRRRAGRLARGGGANRSRRGRQ